MAFDTYNVACRENVVSVASKRHFAIWNASTTHMVVITLVRAIEASTAVVTTGVKVAFGVTRMTGIPTSGTALGWSKADTLQADMPTSIIAVKEHAAGTVSPDFFGAAAVNPEESVSASEGTLYSSPLDMSRPMTLRQNEGIEVRQGTLTSPTPSAVSFVATVYLLPVGDPI